MALRLIKNVLLSLAIINLTGCASLLSWGKNVEPINIQTVAVEKTPLTVVMPEPLKTPALTWIVITPDNAEQVFNDLKGNKVLFAISDNGYQDLSMLMAEIRILINQQRVIILKYKEYYEPKK